MSDLRRIADDPQPGDILTKNGESVVVHFVDDGMVYFASGKGKPDKFTLGNSGLLKMSLAVWKEAVERELPDHIPDVRKKVGE